MLVMLETAEYSCISFGSVFVALFIIMGVLCAGVSQLYCSDFYHFETIAKFILFAF